MVVKDQSRWQSLWLARAVQYVPLPPLLPPLRKLILVRSSYSARSRRPPTVLVRDVRRPVVATSDSSTRTRR
eukprot:scaffold662320_cov113-Prasinocladus_malaysianus.AAC.1